MTKEELRAIADAYFEEQPQLTEVLITVDGQLFLPDHRNAAENHIREQRLGPPVVFEFGKIEEPSSKPQIPSPKIEEPSPKIEEPSPKIEEPSPKIEEPSPKVEGKKPKK